MTVALADVIADNGSNMVAMWSFLTAISLGLLALMGQQISAKREAKAAHVEATKAQENTANLSNGFASGVDSKLTRIIDKQDKLNDAFREHLEWHLDKDT